MVALRRRVPVTDKLLAFIFGVVFLSIILLIAIFIPNPTGFSYTIFRIVVALAAAGIGAVIPGFLNVSFRNLLRAGGAVALFIIVYFFAPAAIGSTDGITPPPPVTHASPVAKSWLQKVDGGLYKQAYQSMSKTFQKTYAMDEVSNLIKGERIHLGAVESRVLNSTTHAVNPPGQPRGHYVAYGFKTRFANEERPIYEAVQVFGEDGQWKVAGFFTYVRTTDGQFVSYEPPERAGEKSSLGLNSRE